MTPKVIPEQERRYLKTSELRITGGDDKPQKIVGYPAVFNKLSENLGGFREKIAPGAFTTTLGDGDDVRALVDHDPSRVLGRNVSGTLKLEQNTQGLKATIKPADTQAGRDILVSLERGDIDGMSFGFRTRTDKWETIDGEEIRTLIDVELFDVSVVTYPAYPDTSVAVRSMEKVKAEAEENAKPKTLETLRMRIELAEKDI